jgi:hypothetical protein
MDMKPAPERISQRLKDQFAPAYLTLTSIIQGVALSVLAARVESTYTQFDATNWLLAIASFLGVLALWQEYLMQVLEFVWVPTLLDSLVPFAFLAGELFTAHFVYGSLRAWLLAFGLTYVVGMAASLLATTQARSLSEENRDIMRVLVLHRRLRTTLLLVIIVLFLGASALYDLLHLGQIQFVVALLALVAIILFICSSVPQWQRVLDYARVRT